MKRLLACVLLACGVSGVSADGSRQATGVKAGEVTDRSAIVWMRLTAQAERNADGVAVPRRKGGGDGNRGALLPEGVRVDDLEGAAPGAPGRVRVRCGTREDLADAVATDWADVRPETDFTHTFRLNNLRPDMLYYFAAETAGPGGSPAHEPLRGSFRTAPLPDQRAKVTFTVVTGMMFQDLDDRKKLMIRARQGEADD